MSSSIQIVCKSALVFLFIAVVGAETADNKSSLTHSFCSEKGDAFFYNGRINYCKELKNDPNLKSTYKRALSKGCCCPMKGPDSCERCEVCQSLNSKMYTNSDVKLSFKNGTQIEYRDTLSLDEEVVCTIPPNSNFPNVSIQITQRFSNNERSTSCDGYKCTHKMLASLKTLPFDLHCSVRLSDEDEPRDLTREVKVTVAAPKDSSLQLKISLNLDTSQKLVECQAKASNFVKLKIRLMNSERKNQTCSLGDVYCSMSYDFCDEHSNVSCSDFISQINKEGHIHPTLKCVSIFWTVMFTICAFCFGIGTCICVDLIWAKTCEPPSDQTNNGDESKTIVSDSGSPSSDDNAGNGINSVAPNKKKSKKKKKKKQQK